MCDVYKCQTVTFDWEGYGQSEGEPTEQSMKRSAECIMDYVLQNVLKNKS